MSDTFDELLPLLTEARNPKTMNIDRADILEMLTMINEEDRKIASAVEKEIPTIAEAVGFTISSFKSGGRLIYVGAGTSGRLGVLDAAECPPTFGSDPRMVVGVIAGGPEALVRPVEGAEDSSDDGAKRIDQLLVGARDTVVGITASGRTPFVIGALIRARQLGARTVGLSTNENPKIRDYVDVMITPIVGPEVITGSTRMKSATAQKLILNMISTASMIGIGKVYQNLMVDLKPWSKKLEERSKKIIMELTKVEYNRANEAFESSGRDLKVAIIVIETGVTPEKAKDALSSSEGHVYRAVSLLRG